MKEIMTTVTQERVDSDDYYEVLGLEKTATYKEIQKAYRALANKYHPDKRGGDNKKFLLLKAAHDILNNAKSRLAYDMYGHFTQEEHSAAQNFMASIIQNAFNQVEDLGTLDLRTGMREVVKINLIAAEKTIQAADKQILKVDKHKHRSKHKAVVQVFDSLYGAALDTKQKAQHDLRVFKATLYSLEQFEYDFETGE